ncbi:MAG: hypothetical protein LIP12_08330 [Clostridiales bacterium]|nr:hypothetical protein [Clostridiales bacterium]
MDLLYHNRKCVSSTKSWIFLPVMRAFQQIEEKMVTNVWEKEIIRKRDGNNHISVIY